MLMATFSDIITPPLKLSHSTAAPKVMCNTVYFAFYSWKYFIKSCLLKSLLSKILIYMVSLMHSG